MSPLVGLEVEGPSKVLVALRTLVLGRGRALLAAPIVNPAGLARTWALVVIFLAFLGGTPVHVHAHSHASPGGCGSWLLLNPIPDIA